MIYTVEFHKRLGFSEDDVFWKDVEAISEEEAIEIVNNERDVMKKHTKIIKNRMKIYSYTDQERGYAEYELLKDNISFKHPDSGEWIEAVLYKSLKDGKEYVRQKVDFINKFKEVC